MSRVYKTQEDVAPAFSTCYFSPRLLHQLQGPSSSFWAHDALSHRRVCECWPCSYLSHGMPSHTSVFNLITISWERSALTISWFSLPKTQHPIYTFWVLTPICLYLFICSLFVFPIRPWDKGEPHMLVCYSIPSN